MRKEKIVSIKDEILKDLAAVDLIDEKKDLFRKLLDQSANDTVSDFKYRFLGNFEIVEGKDSFEEYFERPIEENDKKSYMASLNIYFV